MQLLHVRLAILMVTTRRLSAFLTLRSRALVASQQHCQYATKASHSNSNDTPFSDWRSQWELIGEMAQTTKGPIDSMGAVALAAANGAGFDSPQYRFQCLVATMLSPQTKDGKVYEAFNSLSKLVHPAPLLPSTFQKLSITDIERAIRPCSFYATKARNLFEASQICSSKYGNDIPATLEGLLELQGVGPKVAFLTLSIAWHRDEGICVDTHVHRITQRLGWVDESKQPEKTRKALEKLLPRELWGECNDKFVRFGQTICDAKKPKCHVCLLAPTCRHFNATSTASTQGLK